MAARWLLLPWLLARGCSAWGVEGHERINRVAQGLLFGKHRDQIRTLMHSDVIDVAGFEKTMTAKYPQTDRLHWHHQDPEWACDGRGGLGDKGGHVRCDGKGAEAGSLFCALAYFFEHFAHDALLNEFPKPQEPINTPANLPVLENVPSKDLTAANYLRWMSILVGDLHQPLHWLRQHGYGAEVEVRYKGQSLSLLQFWEEYIPRNLPKLEGDQKKDYKAQKHNWGKKVPTELFRDWAKETAERLCREVYAPMTVNHADGTRVESPFELSDELFSKWSDMAQELMSVGGERLAFVLNEIIEHRRHKEAQSHGRGLPSRKVAVGTEALPPGAATKKAVSGAKDGGSVTGPTTKTADALDPMQLYAQLLIEERRRSWSNFGWNAGIAAVVVPSLLLALRWHQDNGAGFKLREHLKL